MENAASVVPEAGMSHVDQVSRGLAEALYNVPAAVGHALTVTLDHKEPHSHPTPALHYALHADRAAATRSSPRAATSCGTTMSEP